MPIIVFPDELDATILASTPELRADEITDEFREVMTALLSETPNHELSFHERKVALALGWLP